MCTYNSVCMCVVCVYVSGVCVCVCGWVRVCVIGGMCVCGWGCVCGVGVGVYACGVGVACSGFIKMSSISLCPVLSDQGLSHYFSQQS